MHLFQLLFNILYITVIIIFHCVAFSKIAKRLYFQLTMFHLRNYTVLYCTIVTHNNAMYCTVVVINRVSAIPYTMLTRLRYCASRCYIRLLLIIPLLFTLVAFKLPLPSLFTFSYISISDGFSFPRGSYFRPTRNVA
jgi:hypothetical protein